MSDLSTGRSQRRKIKGIFLMVTLVILGLLAWLVLSAKDEAETDKLFTFEGNAERVEFINQQGYIVEPEPESCKITIPTEFNESYTEYNTMQQSQGFDLLPYAGKDVQMYTYCVLNYPDYPENVVINMIFDDHRLIAADITCNETENGFTKPLIANTAQEAIASVY